MRVSFGRLPVPGIAADLRTLGLVIGDLVGITLILAIGLLSHDVNPVASADHLFLTALPFLIGWILTAPLVGMYAASIRESLRWTVIGTLSAWVAASFVGGAIRSTAYFHGGAPAIFIAVTIATGLLVLIPWRLLSAYYFSR